MTRIQKKLKLWIDDRSVNKAAQDMGIAQSKLNPWVVGQAQPNLAGLQALQAGTGIPIQYWADDSIPPMKSKSLEEGPIYCNLFRLQKKGYLDSKTRIPFELNSVEPMVILMQDQAMSPFVNVGQLLVFDYGRPDQVRDNELVVTDFESNLIVGTRKTFRDQRLYVPWHDDFPTISIQLSEVKTEYPVVGTILDPIHTSQDDESSEQEEVLAGSM